MPNQLTIDKAGRVVIPKPLRDSLHLGPGDALELETDGETMTLRPVRSIPPLQKERGIWVHRTGVPLSAAVADETLRSIREERDRRNLGDDDR
jgi:AbrB family looped-hinge helix DNA binding protein